MEIFDVYLRNRLTEIDVAIKQLTQVETLSLYDYLTILCSIEELTLISFAMPNSVIMESDFDVEQMLEIASELLELDAVFDVDVALLKKSMVDFDCEMVADVDSFSLFRQERIEGCNDLELFVDQLDYYIAHGLGTFIGDFDFLVNELETTEYSFEKITDSLELFVELEEGLYAPFEFNQDAVMFCEASVGMKRYRKLEEMDNYNLSDLDDQTLHDLDFIIIAE